MHRSAWPLFIVTAVLTAVTLFVPGLVVAGLIFIVPGLILLAGPLFMYGLVGLVAWRLFGTNWLTGFASAIAAIAVFALLLPLVLNAPVTNLVSELRASDRTLAAPIANARRLALLRPRVQTGRETETETDCRELCQRLLFNGAVDEVLLGTAPAFVVEPSAAQTVTRYRVERRESCPTVKVPTASAWDRENVRGVAFSSIVSDRIKARIANGECLIAEQALLANADAVVVDGKAYESAKHAWDSPWSPLLVSVHAARISVFAPSGGRFIEIYRHTSVESEPLIIPFMANAIFGYGFSVKSGFVRWKNVQGRYELRNTFRDDFKFDVSIPKDVGPEIGRRSPALPSDHPRLTVADAYLNGLNESTPAPGEDVAVVRALIGDQRVRGFFHLPGAVRRLGPEAATLAAPLLERITASRMRADRDIIHSMSAAIKFLPEGALVPVMDRLRILAADGQRRGAGRPGAR